LEQNFLTKDYNNKSYIRFWKTWFEIICFFKGK
jgi:hypothetical protein